MFVSTEAQLISHQEVVLTLYSIHPYIIIRAHVVQCQTSQVKDVLPLTTIEVFMTEPLLLLPVNCSVDSACRKVKTAWRNVFKLHLEEIHKGNQCNTRGNVHFTLFYCALLT